MPSGHGLPEFCERCGKQTRGPHFCSGSGMFSHNRQHCILCGARVD